MLKLFEINLFCNLIKGLLFCRIVISCSPASAANVSNVIHFWVDIGGSKCFIHRKSLASSFLRSSWLVESHSWTSEVNRKKLMTSPKHPNRAISSHFLLIQGINNYWDRKMMGREHKIRKQLSRQLVLNWKSTGHPELFGPTIDTVNRGSRPSRMGSRSSIYLRKKEEYVKLLIKLCRRMLGQEKK